jgi:hypothetical protein
MDTSLQINLSAGDVAYARSTVPALVQAHRGFVKETVAVVDCCRPQRTKIVDPDARFPLPMFLRRVDEITSIAEELHRAGVLDRVYYLRASDPLLSTIQQKYLNNRVQATHDYGGCALTAYLAAFEVIKTRYLLHYDGDMLLHQQPGFDWAEEAIPLLARHSGALAATPRISPPFSERLNVADGPSRRTGRPYVKVDGGWRDDWFSTRCFLMDTQKMSRFLPLLSGRLYLETLILKWLNRGYPRSPELMMFRRIGGGGGWRLNLSTERAWLLHPRTKPDKYLRLLPEIIESLVAGHAPLTQIGEPEVDVEAWAGFVGSSEHKEPAYETRRGPTSLAC